MADDRRNTAVDVNVELQPSTTRQIDTAVDVNVEIRPSTTRQIDTAVYVNVEIRRNDAPTTSDFSMMQVF